MLLHLKSSGEARQLDLRPASEPLIMLAPASDTAQSCCACRVLHTSVRWQTSRWPGKIEPMRKSGVEPMRWCERRWPKAWAAASVRVCIYGLAQEEVRRRGIVGRRAGLDRAPLHSGVGDAKARLCLRLLRLRASHVRRGRRGWHLEAAERVRASVWLRGDARRAAAAPAERTDLGALHLSINQLG